jgi:dephospho-CoA kinase
MECVEVAHALFEVTAESGRVYTVDLQEPVCQCRDFQHREEVTECKHIRRVRLEVGQVDLVALEDEIEQTASELRETAEQFTSKAQDLSERASELNDVVHRLREVTE